MDADDLPLSPTSKLRTHPDVCRALEDSPPSIDRTRAAILAIVSSGDPQSGDMLNYMFEMGISNSIEPTLPVIVASNWESPAYVDMLSTLVEFHFDFGVKDAHGVSARQLVERRAPGIFGLLKLKAHLVSTGAWPDYESIALD